MKFSTKDQDNDVSASTHCAQRHKGGWWYSGRPQFGCVASDLNGNGMNILWSTFPYPIKSLVMKIADRKWWSAT